MKATLPVVDARICSVCGKVRTLGSHLEVTSDDAEDTLWVCQNCQHKLTRGLDDEGALGG